MVVPQLIDMTYKVHLGLFEEDVLLKLATYSYNVVVIYENFKGSTLAEKSDSVRDGPTARRVAARAFRCSAQPAFPDE